MENQDVRLLRWDELHELFNLDEPVLVVLTDALDEVWYRIPGDVRAILETMQSTAHQRVHVYEVDFRVDPDFLELFGSPRAPAIARRRVGEDHFEVIGPDVRLGELIEFCRAAFEDGARPNATFIPPPPPVRLGQRFAPTDHTLA